MKQRRKEYCGLRILLSAFIKIQILDLKKFWWPHSVAQGLSHRFCGVCQCLWVNAWCCQQARDETNDGICRGVWFGKFFSRYLSSIMLAILSGSSVVFPFLLKFLHPQPWDDVTHPRWAVVSCFPGQHLCFYTTLLLAAYILARWCLSLDAVVSCERMSPPVFPWWRL